MTDFQVFRIQSVGITCACGRRTLTPSNLVCMLHRRRGHREALAEGEQWKSSDP